MSLFLVFHASSPIALSRIGQRYHRPGFKKHLMFQDVTAKYCIYDKVHTITADVVFGSNKGLCQFLYDDLST